MLSLMGCAVGDQARSAAPESAEHPTESWTLTTPSAVFALRDGGATLRWEGHTFSIAVPPADAVRRSGDALEFVRGETLERLSLVGNEVHQSFRFDHPLTEAQLVRVTLQGLTFDHSDDAGLHFTTHDGAPGPGAPVRYSHARLIDAEGRTVPVRAVWRDGYVELRVPARPDLRAPVVLDPVLGPERPVDAPVAVVTTSFDHVAVTASGPGYRMLYGVEGLRNAELAPDLSGAPTYGTSLGRLYGFPALARAGDVFLAAWAEPLSGGAQLALRRFGRDGSPLDPAPVTMDGSTLAPMHVAVASDGTDFLVVYEQLGSVVARRVRADGTVEPSALLGDGCLEPAVVFSSGRYIAAFTCDVDADGHAEVVGTTVSTGGVPDAVMTVLGDVGLQERSPRLATSGAGVVLAWTTSIEVRFAYQPERIWVRRVDDDAALGLGPALAVAGPPSFERDPDLSLSDDGMTSLVVWTERSAAGQPTEVLAARVSSAGVLLDATARRLGEGSGPSAAPGVGEHLVVFVNQFSPVGSPLGRRLRDDGTSPEAAPVPLVSRGNAQVAPVLEAGGGLYLAAFGDARTPNGIYAVRVDPALGPLDAPALYLTTGLPARIREFDVVFVGDAFQVLYSVDRGDGLGSDLWGTRVALDGSVDPPRIWYSGPGYQESPAAAVVDGTVLLTWLDGSAGGSHSDVWARRYSVDGTPLGAAFVVDASQRNTRVWVVSGHGLFVVYWHILVPLSAAQANYAVRFRADGTRLDATPRVLPGIRATSAVVFPTSTNFVALGTEREDTYAATLDPLTGVVAGRNRLTAGFVTTGWYGAIEADGGYWGIRFSVGATRSIELVPVGADARVPAGLTAVPLAIDPIDDDLSAAFDGRDWAVAYNRVVPEVPSITRRVFVRFGDSALLADGTPCTEDASCDSGFCTDGVCCDLRCGGGTSDCQACSVPAGAVANGVCSPRGAGTTCRAAAGPCDSSERCDGVLGACPMDVSLDDGSACGDPLACNGAEVCAAGVCVAGSALDCADLDPCTIDSCMEPSGCAHVRDVACDDAGLPDAGPDAGAPDSGVDAGLPDAGMDAGSPDSGVDASRPDAGVDVGADGGVDAGPPAPPPGCACGVERRAGGAPLALVVLACLAASRRRRRRPL